MTQIEPASLARRSRAMVGSAVLAMAVSRLAMQTANITASKAPRRSEAGRPWPAGWMVLREKENMGCRGLAPGQGGRRLWGSVDSSATCRFNASSGAGAPRQR
ncbi:hypothetical protein [Achromobacter xylosoxidans]|uniref:hypothetical protein n=1 Tax=Alcaligenes xylosoxydans xylosoxydans TaxID=85698 RepID=UPI001ED8C12E